MLRLGLILSGKRLIAAKESPDYYELKKHKLWFDEGSSKLLDNRKQATLQWVTGSKLNKWR
jgi:hypothetical protein